MGDSLIAVTYEEIQDHTKRLREQTEATVHLLEKLFKFSDGLCKRSQSLDQQLAEESKRRTVAEEAAKQAKTEINTLKTKVEELEAKNSGLESTVEEKAIALGKMVEERAQEISGLHEEIQSQEALMRGLKYLRQNVDALRLGGGVLEEPCGACMLPDGCVLVADTLQGLLLYSCNTELIRQVQSDDWKWPQGLVYDTSRNIILVTMMQRKQGDKFERVIAEFSLSLELLCSVDGPKDVGYDNISKERLALAPSGEMYLSLADKVGSALYKYMSAQWFLLSSRQGVSFADVQVLATTGPITEVLVVETRMGYIHKLAVRGADIADRRSLAVVEKPGAICVDNKGQLFVQDVISRKVRQIDTIKFEPIRDVCIVDDAVFSITASHGYLGVAVREAKLVQIFRYTSSAIVI